MVELVVVGWCGWRLVGDDGGGGVGRGSGGFNLDGVHLCVIDERRDAEVEVGLRASDGFLASSTIGVYDSSYRWPKGSPRESGATEKSCSPFI
jgi:hypothetical protein